MNLRLRQLGFLPYEPVWHAMQAFTAGRDAGTTDELWLVEHPPIFTLGLAGKTHHVITPGDIEILHVDRGGQVTYHGPGQCILYVLLDIRRLQLGVRTLVKRLEQVAVTCLRHHGITASVRREAPGVYVDQQKIAALGLRVRQGRCYHGLALNVDMDLEPFSRINPCGFPGLEVTQLANFGISSSVDAEGQSLAAQLASEFGYAMQDVSDESFKLVAS
ncbi:MAG: lipoyl(octanoyl) transferase LipB [Gammaproteobacteria bacterium]|nr:MAG: lipoyl(octanoyl) transferase LipB [Gammaproteobacteria bacterium]